MYYAIKGAAPKMPPVKYGRYLTELLADIGTVMLGANGFVPLTWSEIQAWSQMTGTRLDWWEAETIRRMSEAYANWSAKGQQFNVDPPWSTKPAKTQAEKITDTIKSVRIDT